MDGRGQAVIFLRNLRSRYAGICTLGNIFVERLWLTVKYEDIYRKDYGSVLELDEYFGFYNQGRPHALANHTPFEARRSPIWGAKPRRPDDLMDKA
uniref:Putative transposase n=1 Tax=Candidatus Kentrum sp. MB TaxID=2138164 RepID=A0A450XXD6_9GAMM|nr:MAG: putative transposase [Candidatus Kentron sp. MB]